MLSNSRGGGGSGPTIVVVDIYGTSAFDLYGSITLPTTLVGDTILEGWAPGGKPANGTGSAGGRGGGGGAYARTTYTFAPGTVLWYELCPQGYTGVNPVSALGANCSPDPTFTQIFGCIDANQGEGFTGGPAAASTGDFTSSGGNGGVASTTVGGGPGGQGGPAGNGFNGSGLNGGDSGDIIPYISGNGANLASPAYGYGGGGSELAQTAGNNYPGHIRITYMIS